MPDARTDSLLRQLFEHVFNQGAFAVVDELLAPGSVSHTATWGVSPNRQGLNWKGTQRVPGLPKPLRVDYFKVGIDLRTESPTPEAIRRAAERVLREPRWKQNAARLRDEFSRYRPYELIDAYLANGAA